MRQQPESNDHLDSKIGTFHKDPSASTIYVGNLIFEKDELQIKSLFEDFGYVNYVKLIKDQRTHESTGIAFVQMPNRKEAMYAISQLNGSQVDGRSLKASIAVERDQDRVKASKKKKRRKPYRPYVSKADRAAQATSS